METTPAEQAYAEEIAAGATPRDAAIIAASVRRSPDYRDARLALLAARLREREEQEEKLLKELDYPGNPCLEEL